MNGLFAFFQIFKVWDRASDVVVVTRGSIPSAYVVMTKADGTVFVTSDGKVLARAA